MGNHGHHRKLQVPPFSLGWLTQCRERRWKAKFSDRIRLERSFPCDRKAGAVSEVRLVPVVSKRTQDELLAPQGDCLREKAHSDSATGVSTLLLLQVPWRQPRRAHLRSPGRS